MRSKFGMSEAAAPALRFELPPYNSRIVGKQKTMRLLLRNRDNTNYGPSGSMSAIAG